MCDTFCCVENAEYAKVDMLVADGDCKVHLDDFIPKQYQFLYTPDYNNNSTCRYSFFFVSSFFMSPNMTK